MCWYNFLYCNSLKTEESADLCLFKGRCTEISSPIFFQNKVWRMFRNALHSGSFMSLLLLVDTFLFRAQQKEFLLEILKYPNKMSKKQHLSLSLSASLASFSFSKEPINWMSYPRCFWHPLYFCTTYALGFILWLWLKLSLFPLILAYFKSVGNPHLEAAEETILALQSDRDQDV